MHHKNVLIVDDNVEDAFLLYRALRRLGVEAVSSVVSAEQAAQYLNGLSPFEMRVLPDIILLDLKLGGIDGLNLVKWLKGNVLFAPIPVFIFSGSTDPKLQAKALEHGAVAFYEKKSGHDLENVLREVLQQVENSARIGSPRL